MPRGDLADLTHPSAGGVRFPRPTFGHLRDLTEDRGLWEHARYSMPRPEHGFCNDDNARALVVVAREQTEDLTDLAVIYLGFVLSARKPDGRFHNRRDSTGSWVDDTGSDDSEGRAWWGLGAIARQGPEAWMKEAALEEFESCATFQSLHLRSNAYAALGAAEVVTGRGPGPTCCRATRSSKQLDRHGCPSDDRVAGDQAHLRQCPNPRGTHRCGDRPRRCASDEPGDSSSRLAGTERESRKPVQLHTSRRA